MSVATSEVFAAHVARRWSERHDEAVHVFANGHRYGRAERRASLRACIACIRRFRDRERPRALTSR